jgi:hypothetical protein
VTSDKPHACPTCQRRFSTTKALADHARSTHEHARWTATREQKHRQRTTPPICPECGRPATMTATRYGARADCCGLHSYRYKPLVNHETHQARQAAHAAFDALWMRGEFSRAEGYHRLQVSMGMTAAECQIAKMTAEAANWVVKLSRDGTLLEMADA